MSVESKDGVPAREKDEHCSRDAGGLEVGQKSLGREWGGRGEKGREKGEKGEKKAARELRGQEEMRERKRKGRGPTAKTITAVVYYSLLTCGRRSGPSPFSAFLLLTTHPSSHSVHPSLVRE